MNNEKEAAIQLLAKALLDQLQDTNHKNLYKGENVYSGALLKEVKAIQSTAGTTTPFMKIQEMMQAFNQWFATLSYEQRLLLEDKAAFLLHIQEQSTLLAPYIEALTASVKNLPPLLNSLQQDLLAEQMKLEQQQKEQDLKDKIAAFQEAANNSFNSESITALINSFYKQALIKINAEEAVVLTVEQRLNQLLEAAQSHYDNMLTNTPENIQSIAELSTFINDLKAQKSEIEALSSRFQTAKADCFNSDGSLNFEKMLENQADLSRSAEKIQSLMQGVINKIPPDIPPLENIAADYQVSIKEIKSQQEKLTSESDKLES